MVTASVQPAPAVAAVVACATVTTRYMPAAGVGIKFVEQTEPVWEPSDTLPKMLDVWMQLPEPLMACRVSQVPTPEFAGSLHTVPSKYSVIGRPARIWPLVGSVSPSDCLMFFTPRLSTFNVAAPGL